MRRFRTPVSRAGTVAVAGLIAVIGVSPLAVSGADHLDAPGVKADTRLDITDVYAFRAGASQTALVLNVNGLLSPAASRSATFRPFALYEFKIDTNLDGRADLAYRIRFSSARTLADGARVQDYMIRRATGPAADRNEWSGGLVGVGKTTPYGRTANASRVWGGGLSFAGPRDDPFFFDLPGFVTFKEQLLGGSTDLGELLGGFTGTDTFAGTNVMSIVVKVPNAHLGGTGHTVGVWGTTTRLTSSGWQQQDRMGRPAINTVFNGLALPLDAAANGTEKDAFNAARPTTDLGTTKGNVVAVLNAIGNVLTANGATPYSAGEVDAIAGVLLPDTLTLKLGLNAPFATGTSLGTLALNGRGLADDVIDAEFALLTNFVITTGDGVNANDRGFGYFPYLASPN